MTSAADTSAEEETAALFYTFSPSPPPRPLPFAADTAQSAAEKELALPPPALHSEAELACSEAPATPPRATQAQGPGDGADGAAHVPAAVQDSPPAAAPAQAPGFAAESPRAAALTPEPAKGDAAAPPAPGSAAGEGPPPKAPGGGAAPGEDKASTAKPGAGSKKVKGKAKAKGKGALQQQDSGCADPSLAVLHERIQALSARASEVVSDAGMHPDHKIRELHAAVQQQAGWLQALERDVAEMQVKLVQAHKEREAVLQQSARGATVQTKLQALCKELQVQNKAVIAESRDMAERERKRREELSDQFLTSLKDVERRLGEQGDSQVKLIQENHSLLEQLQKSKERAQLREKEIECEFKKSALEQKIAELKLQQHEQRAAKDLAEREALLAQLQAQRQEQVQLRDQMSEYGKRFQECQDMLAKSNQVMSTFKDDRAKMLGKVKKVERENVELRAKCGKNDAALFQLMDERTGLQKQLATLQAQKQKLESLCRTLQEERKATSAQPPKVDQGHATAPDSTTHDAVLAQPKEEPPEA